MGGKPPKPPWLRDAARHYAFRQAEPTTKTAPLVWINWGLDSSGFDGGWKLSRVWGNYYILQNSWFGTVVVWMSMKVVNSLSRFLEWGQAPQTPLASWRWRATTHSARRSLWTPLRNQVKNLTTRLIQHLFNSSSSFCSVGIWSIRYLFSSPLVQLTFCSIDFCSAGFLFNGFVQMT